MTALKQPQDAAARAAPRTRLAPPFDQLLFVWLLLVAVLAVAYGYAALTGLKGTEAWFLIHQDTPVMALCMAITAALGLAPGAWLARARIAVPSRPWLWIAAMAAVSFAVCAAGARLIFHGYALSLDEFMANFDAKIIATGHVLAPVDPAWRPFVPALQPMYLLPIPDHRFWASAYLPVNAAMRAAARLAHAAWLVNPLLAAFSILAVWGVGRRLWPQRRDIALTAVCLLVCSPQFLLMSTTAYAMSAHLAFNLAWMWLFLRGGRLGHAGAIAVGLLATGLHQLMFHPLFVAPFVLQLWLDRRWSLAGLYTGAYALICGFWIELWPVELRLLGETAHQAGAVGGGWLLQRGRQVLDALQLGNMGAIAESLIRFATWQVPLVAPLLCLGALPAERANGHLRAMILGVVLTLMVVLLLAPSQTHGWGYRYFHGFLGSICLIAAWTWASLTDALRASQRATAQGAMTLACLVSLLVLTPLRAWQVVRYVTPYAAAAAAIQAAPSQVVIVDHEGDPGFDPGTVVRNDPFLQRGPKVMELSYMTSAMVADVCRRYSVQVFTGRDAAGFGIDTVPLLVEPNLAQQRTLMRQLRCGRPMVASPPG